MNFFKTGILMLAMMFLFMIVGEIVAPGGPGIMFAFILSLVMNFFAYWFSDKIALAMYRAKPADRSSAPILYDIVERLSQRANLPMPKVYVIPTESPNAFATGRSPKHAAVAATSGILRLLSHEELEGVIGHELAHIKHRDILLATIVATFAGAITMIARMAGWAAMFGGYGRRDDDEGGGSNMLSLLFLWIVAPIAAVLIQLAISRAREYYADAEGAKIAGNPLSLASALERLHHGSSRMQLDANPATAHMFIVNPLRGGGIWSLFSTHPPMEERVRRLEAMARV